MTTDKTTIGIQKRIIMMEEKIKVFKFLAENEYEEKKRDNTHPSYLFFYSENKKEGFLIDNWSCSVNGRFLTHNTSIHFSCDSFDDFINMYISFSELFSLNENLAYITSDYGLAFFQYINREIHSDVVSLSSNTRGFLIYDKSDSLFKIVLTDFHESGEMFWRDFHSISEKAVLQIERSTNTNSGAAFISVITPNMCNLNNVFPKLVINRHSVFHISSFANNKQ